MGLSLLNASLFPQNAQVCHERKAAQDDTASMRLFHDS
jgi:hypothetical protein